jgi:hypothetical protein
MFGAMTSDGIRHDGRAASLRQWIVVAALAAVTFGCGGRDGGGAGPAPGADAAPVEDPTDDGAAAAAAADGGAVPDACGAFTATDLASTLGAEGSGTPGGGGSRTVCSFTNGVIVGVSEAGQYEGSVSLARGAATCEEVAGVGDRAVFCSIAGVTGQLMWVEGPLMYDVTAANPDREAFVALAKRRG